MWDLAGKRVLVTAGGDGIGLEITRAFVEAGAKVLVCDIRPESLAPPVTCAAMARARHRNG